MAYLDKVQYEIQIIHTSTCAVHKERLTFPQKHLLTLQYVSYNNLHAVVCVPIVWECCTTVRHVLPRIGTWIFAVPRAPQESRHRK